MWHTALISVHALAGATALLAGCAALARRVLYRTYLASLATMELFLVLTIAAGWADLGTTARILFTAFAGLGVFMLWRADQALRTRPAESAQPSEAHVEHLGFTLVALTDAFLVILVLDAGAPTWAVVATGLVVAAAGHFVLGAVRERLTRTRAVQRA